MQDQPLEILLLLLERKGEVVTRDELKQRLWPADTFVESDDGINTAISKLREVLGDSAEKPVYIETIPRRGYRFIEAVEAEPIAPETSLKAEAPVASPVQMSPLISTPRGRLLGWAGVGALVFAAIAGSVWMLIRAHRTKSENSTALASLAVLPFENLSGDPSQDYFADAMTEELTSDLGRISALRVISRTSATRYKKTQKTAPEIAGELNVDGLIEGSVVRSGDRVRITAQLISARADKHIWSESYERDLKAPLHFRATSHAQSQARFRL